MVIGEPEERVFRGGNRDHKRSDDLSTGLLIVIILVDLGLLTFGVRGRVH